MGMTGKAQHKAEGVLGKPGEQESGAGLTQPFTEKRSRKENARKVDLGHH